MSSALRLPLLVSLLLLSAYEVRSQTLHAATAAHAPVQKPTAEDRRLQAIYNAEWTWRQRSRGEEDEDTEARPHIRPNLPRVDPATQADRLRF